MDFRDVLHSAFAFVNGKPWLLTGLLALGALSVMRGLYQTSVVLLQTFVLPGKSLKSFGAKKGAWAVVTGASTGIGKEFAVQLAKAGFNIVLVARNEQLLDSVAAEIVQAYPTVSTKVLTADFATADDSVYESLKASLGTLDVGVLVNNVGKSHSMPVYFQDTPKDELVDIPAININATLRVTHAILPGMVQRKRGLILNIGSFAGSIPSPMLATYSGTKAFLATWTSALASEVKDSSIIVEHVNTYFVVSKLSKIRRSSATVPNPAQYVRSVLSKIGLPCGAGFSDRPNTSTPYWSHSLIDYALTIFGIRADVAIQYTLDLHKSIRKRALLKQERAAKKQ